MADPDAFFSYLPAAWVISNNPKLASVALHGFSCNNGLIARTLIRELSCLHCLKDLCLDEVDHEFQIPLAFTTNLFDCLPASIETLSLVYFIGNAEPAQFAEFPSPDDADAGLEPLRERQGPLSSLLELRLPQFDGSYSAELITRFLRQCPKLNILVLPNPMAIGVMPSTGVELANTIHQHCPNVRNVSILDPVETAPVDRDAVVATLDTLNPRHVETIVWQSFRDNTSHTNLNLGALPPIFPAVNRFGSTMIALRIYKVSNTNSTTIRSILSSFGVLKTLIIRGATPATYAITVEGVTDAVWACSKLEHLELAVSLNADNSDATLAPARLAY